MKALNYKERRKANTKFIGMFLATLLLMFGCGFFVLQLAHKGVDVLEKEHSTYTRAFQNQALVTFKIEEAIDKIKSLKTVNRTISQQKHLQGIISNIRLDIEAIIKKDQTPLKEFALYSQLLDQISAIQSTIDLFERDEESYRYSQQLLERCREKYREISLGIVGDNDGEIE